MCTCQQSHGWVSGIYVYMTRENIFFIFVSYNICFIQMYDRSTNGGEGYRVDLSELSKEES